MNFAENYVKMPDGTFTPTLGYFGSVHAVIYKGVCYCSELPSEAFISYVKHWAETHRIAKIVTADQNVIANLQWVEKPELLESQMEIFGAQND